MLTYYAHHFISIVLLRRVSALKGPNASNTTYISASRSTKDVADVKIQFSDQRVLYFAAATRFVLVQFLQHFCNSHMWPRVARSYTDGSEFNSSEAHRPVCNDTVDTVVCSFHTDLAF